jgi:hypothetical protein
VWLVVEYTKGEKQMRKELGFFDPSEYAAYGVITSQRKLRKRFWRAHPELELEARKAKVFSKRQNFHSADARCRWVEWLDELATVGLITDGLADSAIL